ncbi:hypothetical protein AAC387_Pa05g3322 [Persea americana]
MKKDLGLLEGKTTTHAAILVVGYSCLCWVISLAFDMVVRYDGVDGIWFCMKILLAGVLVGLLMGLNLVGLMVQSFFYSVCKSIHHVSIEKNILPSLLEGYVNVHKKVDRMI